MGGRISRSPGDRKLVGGSPDAGSGRVRVPGLRRLGASGETAAVHRAALRLGGAGISCAAVVALIAGTPTPLTASRRWGRAVARAAEPAPPPTLDARLRVIVLHTLGGPDYSRPERRWTFLAPSETLALWGRPSFGAHWIVWTDGSIWPRRRAAGEPESFSPADADPASAERAARLARHAEPVLSHVEGANTRSLGIEVAHSGRSDDPFPPEQIRSLVWLLRSIFALSDGRLGPRSVVGHKDLDRQPAWVPERCPEADCPVYVDPDGRAYRRRVDPPESLFAALAGEGLLVPRPDGEADADLRRAEDIPAGRVPATEPGADLR